MIALTWLGCFGSLLPTLFGQWGVFGLDEEMGSCSILQDSHHHSPKEFLFVVAFLLPCVAIIVCYARIFFIVRQAAAVSHGQRPMKSFGSADARSTGPNESLKNPKSIYKSKAKTEGPEPSYQLTCGDSAHGSGSTEMSDDHMTNPATESTEPVAQTAPPRIGTNTRWKDNSAKSAIRIEVEQGSEVADDIQQLPLPTRAQPERRRISVTFSLGIENHPPTADPQPHYLSVPSSSSSRTPNNSSSRRRYVACFDPKHYLIFIIRLYRIFMTLYTRQLTRIADIG